MTLIELKLPQEPIRRISGPGPAGPDGRPQPLYIPVPEKKTEIRVLPKKVVIYTPPEVKPKNSDYC